MDSVVKSLEDIFKKFPPLPANAVDTLFKIAPWIALVFGILGLIGAWAGLSYYIPFFPVILSPLLIFHTTLGGIFAFIASIGLGISSVMMLMAYPGLKGGKKAGWNMLFASELVSIVSSVIGVSVGTIIGAAIGLYLLFAIKPKYK